MNEEKLLVVDNSARLNARYFWQQFENLQSKIDKVNELLEELEYNQNINITKGLENRVNVDYIIERLNDCIGDDK